MSCICRKPRSPYWMAKYRDANGRIVMRSTKQTKHTEARKIAEGWEAAAKSAGKHELTRAAATKVLDELMKQAGLGTFHEESICDFLWAWHKSREQVGRAGATSKRYHSQIEGVLAFLGVERAKGSIASLSAAELEAWRDAEKESGKAPKTVNFSLATIRAALESAKRKGLVLSNQADAVERLEGRAEEREPFTAEELQALMKTENLEWRGMIALGAHAGLRLSDAANLTWGNVDLTAAVMTFRPAKTEKTDSKPLVIAMHSELVETLQALPQGIAKAPVFPSLYGQKPGSAGGLSNQFAAVMKKAGVVVALGREKAGKGRQTRSKGFHALRHTMISRMANAEISSDVRRSIAGHSSDAMHSKYTHLSLDAQKVAVKKMEAILK
ncbi:MAG: tyrosine-type recombinase/integrase [Verrucomicrobiae bacterium]